jgi:hypothetical protein
MLLDECCREDGAVSAEVKVEEEEDLATARLHASLAHGLYISWHFIAMLAFMTYNVGVCVVLCIGVTVGHFVFKTGRRRGKRGAASCHEATGDRYSQRGSLID